MHTTLYTIDSESFAKLFLTYSEEGLFSCFEIMHLNRLHLVG